MEKGKKHINIYLRIKKRHHKSKTKQKIDISEHAINNNREKKTRELNREKKIRRLKTIKKCWCWQNVAVHIDVWYTIYTYITFTLVSIAYHYSYPKTVRRSIIKSWSQVIRLGCRTHTHSHTTKNNTGETT